MLLHAPVGFKGTLGKKRLMLSAEMEKTLLLQAADLALGSAALLLARLASHQVLLRSRSSSREVRIRVPTFFCSLF